MEEYAVRLKDVTFFNKSFTMSHLTLDIKKGYITVITGENGSGKTALTEAIAGAAHITEGEVLIENYNLHTQFVQAKNQIGFIFRNCPFDKHLTPFDCMNMYGGFYQEFDNQSFQKNCQEFQINLKEKIIHMSKGQAIKLQLAFALAHDAKILILDDATEGLDPVFRKSLKKKLSELVSDGNHTVIMASKLPEDFDRIADYIVTLKDGKIQEIMDAEEIREKCPQGIAEYLKKGGGEHE